MTLHLCYGTEEVLSYIKKNTPLLLGACKRGA